MRVLRAVRAFSEIPLTELEKIAQFFTETSYRRGHVFYTDVDETLHVLDKGEASICVPTICVHPGEAKRNNMNKGDTSETHALGASRKEVVNSITTLGLPTTLQSPYPTQPRASESPLLKRSASMKQLKWAQPSKTDPHVDSPDARMRLSYNWIKSRSSPSIVSSVGSNTLNARRNAGNTNADSSPQSREKEKEMLRPIHRLFKPGELFGEGGVFETHAGGLAVIADTDLSTLWISKAGRGGSSSRQAAISRLLNVH